MIILNRDRSLTITHRTGNDYEGWMNIPSDPRDRIRERVADPNSEQTSSPNPLA